MPAAGETPEPIGRNRLHRVVGRIALVFPATALALLAAEGAIRLLRLAPAIRSIDVYSPSGVYQVSDNPVLGYEPRPFARLSSAFPHIDAEKDRLLVNSHGLFDRERTIHKPDGTRRIILLGDSVLEDMTDEARNRLSEELSACFTDSSIQVLNFGVGGYCTGAEVELLRTKGLRFDPDTVVLVFTVNDFRDLNSEMQIAMASPSSVVQRWMHRNSHLLRLLHACLERPPDLEERIRLVQNHMVALGDNNVPRGLDRLRRMAREHGFETVIVVWPTFGQDCIEDMPAMPDGKRLVVEVLARGNGIPCFRLSPYFVRDMAARGPGQSPAALYAPDGMHPSALGVRVGARAIYDILTRQLARSAGDRALRPEDTNAAMAALRELPAYDRAAPTPQSITLYGAGFAIADGRPGAAIPDLEKLIELQPERWTPWFLLGCVHVALKDEPAALRCLTRACRMTPGRADVRYGLRVWRSALGGARMDGRPLDMALVVGVFEQALAAVPDAARVHWDVLLTIRGVVAATETVMRLEPRLEANPTSHVMRAELGAAFRELGHTGRAATLFREALQLSPHYRPARIGLADALVALGDTSAETGRRDEAETAYREALAFDENNVRALAQLGSVLRRTGRSSDAIPPLQRAVSIAPDDFDAHLVLADVFADLGQHVEAMAHYREAIRIDPHRSAAAYFNLGMHAGSTGSRRESRRYLTKALELALHQGQTSVVARARQELRRMGPES